MRKAETFVFLTLFLALPFFAEKVVEHTATQLAVKNAANILFSDLVKARADATRNGPITISSESKTTNHGAIYMIIDAKQAQSEVVLPPGVSMIGSVTFTKSGVPDKPASFLVSKGSRTTNIEIDKSGTISISN